MSSQTELDEKITLKGRLSIGNAQKVYSQIRAYWDGLAGLMIYLAGIKEMDLAFIQILYSLLWSAHKMEKKVSVYIDDPESIWSSITGAGFGSHFRVVTDSSDTNFKIEGIFNE